MANYHFRSISKRRGDCSAEGPDQRVLAWTAGGPEAYAVQLVALVNRPDHERAGDYVDRAGGTR